MQPRQERKEIHTKQLNIIAYDYRGTCDPSNVLGSRANKMRVEQRLFATITNNSPKITGDLCLVFECQDLAVCTRSERTIVAFKSTTRRIVCYCQVVRTELARTYARRTLGRRGSNNNSTRTKLSDNFPGDGFILAASRTKTFRV